MDSSQQVGKSGSADCDLSHLEDKVSPVVDHFGAYLDNLDKQAPQGPGADRSRQSKSPQEVAQVVGKNEQGQANLVGIGEARGRRLARTPGDENPAGVVCFHP
jgi:hypothetical protein